jgi:hypothetical protein
VKSSALPEFWDCLADLPPPVQKIARKNFKLWQKNPSLKSLGFKKIKNDLWSSAPVRAFARWQLLKMAAIFGSGSPRTTNTNASSATCNFITRWKSASFLLDFARDRPRSDSEKHGISGQKRR